MRLPVSKGTIVTLVVAMSALQAVAQPTKSASTPTPNTAAACATVAECAQKAVDAAQAAQHAAEASVAALKASMAGAVVAFNRNACPGGWSLYEPAQGRFIRGIDLRNPGNVDPAGKREPGNVQDDQVKAHSHSINYKEGQADGGHGYWAKSFDSNSVGMPGGTTSTREGGGDETRPKNVALLYCEFK